MNRLVFGLVLVLVTSKTCTLATARNVGQATPGGWPQAGPPEYSAFGPPPQRPSEDGTVFHSLSPVDDPGYARDPLLEGSQDDVLNDCCNPCCNSCNCPCPRCYGQVEAVFMQRVPGFGRQAIVVDAITDATFLTTSDLDYDFDPGLRATFGMRICGGRALEFSYFGLFSGDASASVVSLDPDDFLIFPDNLFGNVFADFDRAQVNYSSALNSFELNLPCCCGCCDECCDECGRREVRCQSFEWFGGFRYINLDEEFNIAAERDIAGGVEEGNYRIRTANHLYGAQLGARVRRTRGRFGWEGTGKAGIFGNDARQSQSVTDFPDFALRPTVSSRGGDVAFIGEANLSALYRLTETLNLRAGYSAIWIDGLALAPDQLDFNFAFSPSGNQLNNGGSLFLHGVNVGLEARW